MCQRGNTEPRVTALEMTKLVVSVLHSVHDVQQFRVVADGIFEPRFHSALLFGLQHKVEFRTSHRPLKRLFCPARPRNVVSGHESRSSALQAGDGIGVKEILEKSYALTSQC